MRTLLKNIFIVFLLINAIVANAQTDSAFIAIKANPQKTCIQLRWAASSSSAWKLTNSSGFKLERYTIKRNGTLLEQPEKKILAEKIVAIPVEQWESKADQNDYAAIVAEALYGESFEINESSDVMNIINRSKEQDQRFSISLYAADLDFEVACMAGWGFTDKNTVSGEEYLYRVMPADTALAHDISMGFVYTSSDMHNDLPKPPALSVEWGDSTATLSWNTRIYENDFTAYIIEKSTNGKDFESISDIPVLNINDYHTAFYTDTLQNNTTIFYYRLKGISPFGETSQPSDIVEGRGKTMLYESPHITSTHINERGEVEIQWTFSDEAASATAEMALRKASTDKGPFKTVRTGISPYEHSLSYNGLDAVNYFVIVAIPQNGAERTSAPVLVQPVDSVPPAKPIGLTGKIDSTGVVHLSWNANTDADLLGYRVFRSQTENGLKIQLNDIAHETNVFTDTVSLQNLNNKVYYYVAALDYHYNQSDLSDELALSKPDMIPPTASVINGFQSTEKGIWIKWQNSSAEDLFENIIYRAEMGDSLVAYMHVAKEKNEFMDENTIYGKTYQYAIKAIDMSKNASDLSPVISIRSNAETKENISFSVEKNIEQKSNILKWKIKNGDGEVTSSQVYIYKKEGNGSYILLKVTETGINNYTDTMLQVGGEYEYMIKVFLPNSKPIFSKRISIKW
ncbi:MAG: hypothetical protein IKR52_05190 [Paludibacteraceae bacterium]|nr:hypothetical protein [Paludibacteraceae bacterium]